MSSPLDNQKSRRVREVAIGMNCRKGSTVTSNLHRHTAHYTRSGIIPQNFRSSKKNQRERIESCLSRGTWPPSLSECFEMNVLLYMYMSVGETQCKCRMIKQTPNARFGPSRKTWNMKHILHAVIRNVTNLHVLFLKYRNYYGVHDCTLYFWYMY